MGKLKSSGSLPSISTLFEEEDEEVKSRRLLENGREQGGEGKRGLSVTGVRSGTMLDAPKFQGNSMKY